MQFEAVSTTDHTRICRLPMKRIIWLAVTVLIGSIWMGQSVEFSENGLSVSDNIAAAKGGGGGDEQGDEHVAGRVGQPGGKLWAVERS